MSSTSDHASRRTTAIPRSRGALTGLLLLVLGVWGAVIPFIGPTFHYAYTPSDSFHWTSARFFLEVLPGAAAALGGLVLLGSGNRVSASTGGYLALAGGAWFVVGPLLAPIYRVGYLGSPRSGSVTKVALEQIGFFYGLGALIILFAAFALGRVSVVSVRDVAVAEKRRDKNTETDSHDHDTHDHETHDHDSHDHETHDHVHRHEVVDTTTTPEQDRVVTLPDDAQSATSRRTT